MKLLSSQLQSQLSDEQATIVGKILSKIYELGYTCKALPNINVGPIVTVYRCLPTRRTKVSHLENLAKDFAVTLGVEDVLVKRLPGESAVAVFVPNAKRSFIDFKKTMNHAYALYNNKKAKIPLCVVDYLGNPFYEDITTLPHLLIAGSTGSGKSTLVTSLLAQIVYVADSNDVQLVLSDTKNVEFGRFIGAPHLLFPPATSVYQTMEHMEWLVTETNDRLKRIGEAKLRNITEYRETQREMSYILFVIDELADILMNRVREGRNPSVGKIAESLLSTIVQKSRAAGIHVIACTQRPSVNIVAGSIKANFPARLSFRLPSGADSRTVLGIEGAEHLLSQGDMLYVSPNKSGITRLHAPFTKLEDIEACVENAVRRLDVS